MNYHHIEDRWYQTTIRFLYECNAYIETDKQIDILCREHDSCLMDDFMLEQPTPRELKTLNSCRLFLRVLTLSDICTAKGNEIARQCWEGTIPTRTTQLWPKQDKPPANAWLIWRKYLSRCYLEDESSTRKTHDNLCLTQPLGMWRQTRSHRHTWQYTINPISLTLYHTTDTNILVYSPFRNTRTHLMFRPTGHTTYCPPSTIPIDCVPLSDASKSIQIHKRNIPSIPARSIRTISSFRTYLDTLDHWEKQLLRTIHFQCSTTDFLAFSTSPILLATDGSVVENHGSFGWVIADQNGRILATGSGIAFGFKVTSFRSEAYGILAPLRLLYRFHCYHHLPLFNRPITWYCDSESLLKRLNNNLQDTHNPNRYKLADNDLEFTIVQTIPLVSTTLHRHHIRSHQHDHLPLHKLPIPHRLNRIADSLASSAHEDCPTVTNKVPLVAPAGCQLQINKGTITRSYTRMLHNAFTYKQTSRHICNRLGIFHTTMNSIAWDEFDRAFKSFGPGNQRILRRWMFGYLPTQRRLARYKLTSSPLCPICNQHNETDEHFLTCGGSASWQTHLFSPFEHLSHIQNLPTTLQLHVTAHLTNYLDHHQPSDSPQSDLGWFAAFTGLFSITWIELFNQYVPNGSALLAKLIKIVLLAVTDRWKARCHTLHQSRTKTPETRRRLQHQIHALYSCRNYILHQDQHILDTPLSDIIRKPNTYLKMFLSQYRPIIKRSIRLQQDQNKRQHKDIATYFIRIPTIRGSL